MGCDRVVGGGEFYVGIDRGRSGGRSEQTKGCIAVFVSPDCHEALGGLGAWWGITGVNAWLIPWLTRHARQPNRAVQSFRKGPTPLLYLQ